MIKNTSTIPHVVKNTNEGQIGYDILSRILDDRVIMLCDEVNSDTAQIIIAELLYLASVDSESDITMYINSPGGSVLDGFAIYDTMNYIVMIHPPLGGMQGQATDMQIAMNHMNRLKTKLTKYLAEHTGKDFDTIAKDTDRDNWLSAEEAVEYGLVDQIITHID